MLVLNVNKWFLTVNKWFLKCKQMVPKCETNSNAPYNVKYTLTNYWKDGKQRTSKCSFNGSIYSVFYPFCPAL